MACFTPWVISVSLRGSRLRQERERRGKKKLKQLQDVQLRHGGERQHPSAGWALHPSRHLHTSVSLWCQGGPPSGSYLTRGTTLAQVEETLQGCEVFQAQPKNWTGWLVPRFEFLQSATTRWVGAVQKVIWCVRKCREEALSLYCT